MSGAGHTAHTSSLYLYGTDCPLPLSAVDAPIAALPQQGAQLDAAEGSLGVKGLVRHGLLAGRGLRPCLGQLLLVLLVDGSGCCHAGAGGWAEGGTAWRAVGGVHRHKAVAAGHVGAAAWGRDDAGDPDGGEAPRKGVGLLGPAGSDRNGENVHRAALTERVADQPGSTGVGPFVRLHSWRCTTIGGWSLTRVLPVELLQLKRYHNLCMWHLTRASSPAASSLT